MAKEARTGYCNGSDMLVYVGGKAVGHCTSHTATFNSETKDRAVKPVASAGLSAGLWKGKTVTGLSISISAEGLVHYDETESGFKELLAAWKTGAPVTVKCMERANDNEQRRHDLVPALQCDIHNRARGRRRARSGAYHRSCRIEKA